MNHQANYLIFFLAYVVDRQHFTEAPKPIRHLMPASDEPYLHERMIKHLIIMYGSDSEHLLMQALSIFLHIRSCLICLKKRGLYLLIVYGSELQIQNSC
jgi:hypothetical protein